MDTEKILSLMLVFHVVGGAVALLSGLLAMLFVKGSKRHRLAGKVYFGGMTAVFVGATVLAVAHRKDFLLMVGFFSYYMTVRGYRILFQKNLADGTRANLLDWAIVVISGVFIIALLGYGIWLLNLGIGMGIPALVFGLIGLAFIVIDTRKFINAPEKMHWWYGHIGSMGGSYIAAVTAFVVVNVQLPQYNWVLWVLPALIGTFLIARTIRKYKIQFSK